MGMSAGGGGSLKSDINVTPLVDVVLVLLIIFMVITPLMTKQMSVNVPIEAKDQPPPDPAQAEPQVVLSVDDAGRAWVNSAQVADGALATKLKRVFSVRRDQTLFFDAAGSLDYGRAIEILDIARGAGIATIAVLTEPLARSGGVP